MKTFGSGGVEGVAKRITIHMCQYNTRHISIQEEAHAKLIDLR